MSKITNLEKLLILIALIFSTLLMWKTLNIATDGSIQIASKAWSDFSANIPLIRSFSFGDNFPPEYPIFAGPPIRYHFLFYFVVGMLERAGLPLDWALNLPSALSFAGLLVMIYLVGKKIFSSSGVGILSTLLFLFNGSFSFLEFFKLNPLSKNTLSQIVTGTTFPSFGPYDGKIVSAFWNLNIYTNQRHLAFAYASLLLIAIFIHLKSTKKGHFSLSTALLMGIFVGMFPFIHLAVFGMILVLLSVSFFVYGGIRKQILVVILTALVLAVPQILWMGRSFNDTDFVNAGYLAKPLTLLGVLKYWFLNLGITSLLSVFGFLYSNKNQKKFLVLFLPFFIIGNLFQFSTEMAANHKFFNLFVIGLNFFSAYFIVLCYKKSILGKVAAGLLTFLITFSGVIDVFPIFNDAQLTLSDTKQNETIRFIKSNTPPDSVFLNGVYLFDPASMAGRKIYLGWPYFSWSAGYDTDGRTNTLKTILAGGDKFETCNLLNREGIDFLETRNPTPLEGVNVNYDFFEQNFLKIYSDETNQFIIYDVNKSCLSNI